MSQTSQVTIAQAAFLTGKARQTINKFTTRGDLSFSRNAEGAKVIDVSELQRVFPLVRKIEDLDRADLAEEGARPIPAKTGGSEELTVIKVRLESAERERDMLVAERERERRQLQEQIENLQNSLANAQEQGKALLALTDQTAAKPQLNEEQARTNKELAETVMRLERQMRRMQRAQEQQQNQGFFRRWLGTGQSTARISAPAKGSTTT